MCKRQLPNILTMEDFDLRKYLAEGKLLKEEVSQFLIDSFIEGVKDAFGEESNLYATEGDEYEKLETAAEEVISSTDSGDTTVEELIYASQLYALGLAENKLLKEDMSLTMDELEKLANLKSPSDKFKSKKLVDMVMRSVKFNLEKDGTNIENASEDEIDKLRYKWARLKGLLKVKDTFTSMYGKRGVKTNTDKDLLDKRRN